MLTAGIVVLAAADLVLAMTGSIGGTTAAGVVLWGLHMGMTQGLLAAMVADNSPAELRGTAYGFFNLLTGVAILAAIVFADALWGNRSGKDVRRQGRFFRPGAPLPNVREGQIVLAQAA